MVWPKTEDVASEYDFRKWRFTESSIKQFDF